MDIKRINDAFSVAPQIKADDMAEIAAQGFRTVINNRPDGEASDQAPTADMEKAAHAAGLAYHFVPAISGKLTPENVADFGTTIDQAEGPVLAFCRSGTRSATLWALSQAGKLSADEIIRQTGIAGYNVEPLRQFLERKV